MQTFVEKFNDKNNRLILQEGSQTRVSVTNLIRNIASLTPIPYSLDDLLKRIPEYESSFNTLMHNLNENHSEYLFDDSILEHIKDMDTNLGDYLLSVSNLIEQYIPLSALGVDLIATPMYSDVVCYKLTNTLATKLIEKIHLDLQTNNLDAFNCITETLIKMCNVRYYTAERYKKQFDLDLQTTDPEFIENYNEYIETVVTKTIPRLLVQQYVIIEPIGIPEVVSAIKTKIPEVAGLFDVDDLTPEMVCQLIEKIQIKTQELYQQFKNEDVDKAEDFRLRVIDVFTNDINSFTKKNSIQQDPMKEQTGKLLYNALQLPEIIYHSILFASQKLYQDITYDELQDDDIFSYIESILQEVSADLQDENTDLFVLDDMFIYRYLSAFHLTFNADFSILSNMMNQQLQIAYQNTLNILNGITPDEARRAAHERIALMEQQAHRNGGN